MTDRPVDQRTIRMPGDTREPTEADRLARWAEELGIRFQVYPHGADGVTLAFRDRWADFIVEHVRVPRGEDWAAVAKSYLEGEAERQAEARAIGMEGV
jgi:hypothetical protein